MTAATSQPLPCRIQPEIRPENPRQILARDQLRHVTQLSVGRDLEPHRPRRGDRHRKRQTSKAEPADGGGRVADLPPIAPVTDVQVGALGVRNRKTEFERYFS